MRLPVVIKDILIRRNFDWIAARVPGIACGYVLGNGGSSYTLNSGFRVASVAGTGTGICRVTLNDRTLNVADIYPLAVVNDNGPNFCTIGLVSSVPIVFDVYQWANAAGAATNRSFFFAVFFK